MQEKDVLMSIVVILYYFMLSKLKEHPNLGYFLAYSASYLAYGTLITGLGPLIPYLSAKSGIIET